MVTKNDPNPTPVVRYVDAPEHPLVAYPKPQYLEGTFVIDCVEGLSLWDRNNNTVNQKLYALGATVRYEVPANPTATSVGFELDKTEDAGFECAGRSNRPYKSDLVSKFNWKGNISFHGASVQKDLNGTYKVARTFTEASLLIPSPSENSYVEGTVDYLNKYCPCGIEWKSGVYQTVNAADCKEVDSNSGELCQIIAGAPLYSLFKWTSEYNPNARKFVASYGALDEVDGWNLPYFPKNAVPAQGLPESDSHTASDCSTDVHEQLIFECKSAGVFDIIPQYCYGCVDLECTGCIFRHLNHTKDEFAFAVEAWTQCCPCLWYEGTTHNNENAWMKVDC